MDWTIHLTLGQDGGPKQLPKDATGGGATEAKTGQPTTAPVEDQTSVTPPGGNPMNTMIFWMVILILFMWFMVFLPQRRERKRHAQLMSGMGKGDKVVTNGGIIGTVVDVREGEIVLKVDESSNTKMKFLPDAIRGVVEKKGGDKSEDAEQK